MVQTTIIRTPNVEQRRQHPSSTQSRRPGSYPGSYEEHGSRLGTILMVGFSLVLVAWVLAGAA